jgi:hypothetical protein
MPSEFPALEKLGIDVHDGLVRGSGGSNTVRLKDIQRVELRIPLFGTMKLIVHGGFGEAVLAESLFGLTKAGRRFAEAKFELEDLMRDSGASS